jgi:hypothetical protein
MSNLRDLAREVIDQSSSDDLAVMVAALLARIEDVDLRDALQQTLRSFIREVIRQHRTAQPGAVDQPEASEQNESWWVKGMREAHQHRLHDRFHVGETHWKTLALMTYDDLVFAAEERRQIAKRNLGQADLIDAWAALVSRHQVACFGDLPPEVIAAALERPAA